MGTSSKHFIFEETGEVVAVTRARLERLIDWEERAPQYAGKGARIGSAIFDVRNRRLVSLICCIFWVAWFRDDGFMDQERVSEGVRLLLGVWDGTEPKGDGSVLDITPRLYRQRFDAEFRWTPTLAERRKLDAKVGSLLRPK